MDTNLLSYAEYNDIVVGLLKEPFSIRSVPKLIFISFCVKHQDESRRYIKHDIVQRFFETLSGKLLTDIDEISVILSVIQTLEDTGWIRVENIDGHNEVTILTGPEDSQNSPDHQNIKDVKTQNKFLNNMKVKEVNNPILTVNRLDDRAFMEEVMRYV